MDNIKTADYQKIIEDLVKLINNKRELGKSILFLISGGSNIDIALKVFSKIKKSASQPLLHIGLVDERYGLEGHPDSNWQQLINNGLKDDNIQLHPVLHENDSISNTTHRYNQLINDLIKTVDYSLGFFGIGKDGHTAGILPNCPIISSKDTFAYYQGDDFKRISITPKGIDQLDQSFIYAVGKQKWPALMQINVGGSISKIPGRIFKDINNSVFYTDFKGEKV